MSLDEATINDLKKLKEELESNLIHQQQMQDPNQNTNQKESGERE
jgi:hypothetical protein